MKASKAKQAELAERQKHLEAERRRIGRQRTLFTMLPQYSVVDRLKEAMLQRAYDLLCDGTGEEADAILEFVPEKDAMALLDAWVEDQNYGNTKSKWYEPHAD
jgi:hypothetical protein